MNFLKQNDNFNFDKLKFPKLTKIEAKVEDISITVPSLEADSSSSNLELTVEEIIVKTEKLIEEMGFKMLEAKKERILAELNEKKGNWKNALEHYYVSLDAPPG